MVQVGALQENTMPENEDNMLLDDVEDFSDDFEVREHLFENTESHSGDFSQDLEGKLVIAFKSFGFGVVASNHDCLITDLF